MISESCAVGGLGGATAVIEPWQRAELGKIFHGGGPRRRRSPDKVSFTVMPFFLEPTALTGTISLNLLFFCAWAAGLGAGLVLHLAGDLVAVGHVLGRYAMEVDVRVFH